MGGGNTPSFENKKTPLTSLSEEFRLRRYKVAVQDLSDHTDILSDGRTLPR